MKTTIYTISELQDLVHSTGYRESETVPVSPERVLSYMHNPRSEPEMPVLFTLTEGERLLAYRTLLPDHLVRDGATVPFAWLSGNYVVPGRRREGLSTRLFREVEKVWKGQLMYTNYAPASKAVYDRSGVFSCFVTRPGKRYYMRSSLHSLLGERVKAGRLLEMTDRVINAFHDPMIRGMALGDIPAAVVRRIGPEEPLPEKLINSMASQSLFARGRKEFDWIRKYPWVTDKPAGEIEGHYHFTRKVSHYRNQWYHIRSDGDEAFLWITVINDRLSVPYFYQTGKMAVLAARNLVISEMIAAGCSHITIRHPELGPVLGTRKNPFIMSRAMPQHYFVHRSLENVLPEKYLVHDGDGDVVFTG